MARGLQLEVAHTVLYVRDVERMIGFYERVLGFEVTDRGPLRPDGPEIVFLSQTARAHHQLALVTGRSEGGPGADLHHIAYRTTGTLDDLKALHEELKAEPDVTGIRPRTHGNAWSVYFADPEGNGVEIFLDTPWHVAQPCGLPLDLDRPTDELIDWTRQVASDMAEFDSIEAFYARRAEHLARRDTAG